MGCYPLTWCVRGVIGVVNGGALAILVSLLEGRPKRSSVWSTFGVFICLSVIIGVHGDSGCMSCAFNVLQNSGY